MPERRAHSHACEDEARADLLAAALAIAGPCAQPGQFAGSASLSLRWGRSGADGLLITPSAWAGATATPDDIVWLALADDGPPRLDSPTQASAQQEPSAEWRLHCELYRRRKDVGAAIRSRPVFCTTLACLARVHREGFPAFHPDVDRAGGGSIRCVDYAPFGAPAGAPDPAEPQALERVVAALSARAACLLAGRGLLVAGATLRAAADATAELERLAQIYWQVLQVAPEDGVLTNESLGVSI